MKTVYVAGPFRGPDGFAVHMNVVRAEVATYNLIEGALKQKTPIAVCCPHAMTVHLDRTFTDEYWLAATMEWLLRSDAILLLEGWGSSAGARGERDKALVMGIPIFYNQESLLNWLLTS